MERLKDLKIKQLYSGPKLEIERNNSNQVSSLLNQNQGVYVKEKILEFDNRLEKMENQKIPSSNSNSNEKYKNVVMEFDLKQPVIYSERIEIDRKGKKFNKIYILYPLGNGPKTKFPGVAPKNNFFNNKQKPNYDNSKKKAEAFLINFPKNEKKIIKSKPKIVASNRDTKDK